MKGIGESVIALQALKNGNLLMTIKRDVYFKPFERTYTYTLNESLTTGEVKNDVKEHEGLIEACKVSNMVKTFECNITYDDFFSTIESLLVKGGFDESVEVYSKDELWASALCHKPAECDDGYINTQLNRLLGKAIPEEHLGSFNPVFIG